MDRATTGDVILDMLFTNTREPIGVIKTGGKALGRPDCGLLVLKRGL